MPALIFTSRATTPLFDAITPIHKIFRRCHTRLYIVVHDIVDTSPAAATDIFDAFHTDYHLASYADTPDCSISTRGARIRRKRVILITRLLRCRYAHSSCSFDYRPIHTPMLDLRSPLMITPAMLIRCRYATQHVTICRCRAADMRTLCAHTTHAPSYSRRASRHTRDIVTLRYEQAIQRNVTATTMTVTIST